MRGAVDVRQSHYRRLFDRVDAQHLSLLTIDPVTLLCDSTQCS